MQNNLVILITTKPSPITLTFFLYKTNNHIFFCQLMYKMSPEMKLSVNKVFINIYYSKKKNVSVIFVMLLYVPGKWFALSSK